MEAFKLLCVGLAAGVLSGLFGVGGGIIVVPALVFLYGYEQLTANGISLVALLGPVGLLAVWRYHQAGNLQLDQVKQGAWIALGIFGGALLGSMLAVSAPPVLLRRAFAGFLALIVVKLWVGF